MIGRTLSHYQVIGDLGAGGMGSSPAPETPCSSCRRFLQEATLPTADVAVRVRPEMDVDHDN